MDFPAIEDNCHCVFPCEVVGILRGECDRESIKLNFAITNGFVAVIHIVHFDSLFDTVSIAAACPPLITRMYETQPYISLRSPGRKPPSRSE